MPRLSKLLEKIEDLAANRWGSWYERNKARVPLYAVLGGLGYWLGKTVSLDVLMEKIEEYNAYLSYAGLALLVGIVAFMIYRWFSHKPDKKN